MKPNSFTLKIMMEQREKLLEFVKGYALLHLPDDYIKNYDRCSAKDKCLLDIATESRKLLREIGVIE
jgi:hypothetical protein